MLYRLGGSAYRTVFAIRSPPAHCSYSYCTPSLVFAYKQRRRPHNCGGSSRPSGPRRRCGRVSPLSAGRRSSRCASPTRPWLSTRKRRCSSRTRSGLPRSGLDVSAPTRGRPAHACAPWQVLLVKCMMDLMDRDRSASPSHRPFPAVKTLGTAAPSLFVVAMQNVARYCTQPARDRESGRNDQMAGLGPPASTSAPRLALAPATSALRLALVPATSAPGLELAPAASAPGLELTLPAPAPAGMG